MNSASHSFLFSFIVQGENESADANVLVNPSDDWCKQETSVRENVAKHLGQEKIDAVLNMAGNFSRTVFR